MKNQIIINTKDLHSSLMFYRTLFNKMPEQIDPEFLIFSVENLIIKLVESEALNEPEVVIQYQINSREDLIEINHRMRRFKKMQILMNHCQTIGQSLGYIDPNGVKWKIGDDEAETQFDKCYL